MSRAGAPDNRNHLDAYYTPDALAEALVGVLPIEQHDDVLEPSAGGGAFVHALHQRTDCVWACDINPLAPGLHGLESAFRGDFLKCPWTHCDWVIGNPPFGAAEAHVRHALGLSRRNVVMLLRLGFMESNARLPFWEEHGHQLRAMWILSQRPSFTGKRTDSAAYGWFWWDLQHSGPTQIHWLSWR